MLIQNPTSDQEWESEARRSLMPNGFGYDGKVVSGNSDPTPTDSELQTEITRLKAEYDAQEYDRNREAAYDSVGNQLDMLMKDMKNGTTTHQESCEAVKLKYPKP